MVANPERESSSKRGVRGVKDDLRRIFIGPIPGQSRDLRAILDGFAADCVVVDTMFFGALPLALAPRRGAPGAGLHRRHALRVVQPRHGAVRRGPPAGERAAAPGAQRRHELGDRARRAGRHPALRPAPAGRGRSAAASPATSSTCSPRSVDAYLQATVAGFEYPRSDLAPTVRFVGPILAPPSAVLRAAVVVGRARSRPPGRARHPGHPRQRGPGPVAARRRRRPWRTTTCWSWPPPVGPTPTRCGTACRPTRTSNGSSPTTCCSRTSTSWSPTAATAACSRRWRTACRSWWPATARTSPRSRRACSGRAPGSTCIPAGPRLARGPRRASYAQPGVLPEAGAGARGRDRRQRSPRRHQHRAGRVVRGGGKRSPPRPTGAPSRRNRPGRLRSLSRPADGTASCASMRHPSRRR